MEGTAKINISEELLQVSIAAGSSNAIINSRVDIRDENRSKGIVCRWKHISRKESVSSTSFREGLRLIEDIYSFEDLTLTREVLYEDENQSSCYIRLRLLNTGRIPVIVDKLIPFYVSGGENIRLSSSGLPKWCILRQGRHKNDLPSTGIPGKNNGTYRDCFYGLTETGKSEVITNNDPPRTLVSDQLTVIKSEDSLSSLLLGFIEGEKQLVSCSIEMDAARSKLIELQVACLCDNLPLESGEEAESQLLKIDLNPDSLKAIADYTSEKDRYARAKYPEHYCKNRIIKKRPSVYCTWYYYGDSLTQEDVTENIKAVLKRGTKTDVFLVDEGWERRTGEWFPNFRFPDGMKYIADIIKENGMIPGIWTSPFIIESRCDLQYHHPDWILKRKDGKPVLFLMNGVYNLVLDVTHTEVLKWIEELYRRLTFEYGYTYHKLDFTRSVALDPDCLFYNKKATRAEAYRMGYEAVRRGAGKDTYILVCGGLYDAAIGLADGQRTGSDVTSMWPEPDEENGDSAPRTVKQNVLRYWMNELWDNDPDALMVRRKSEKFRDLDLSLGLLTDHEAETLAFNQYWGGGQVCYCEQMNEVDEDRLSLMSHIIPSIGVSAVPRDMFSGKRYPSVMDTTVYPPDGNLGLWHTVSLVNWSNTQKDLEFKLDSDFLGDYAINGDTYIAAEFKTGEVWEALKYSDSLLFTGVKAHETIHLRITKAESDRPVLIYTNGNYSMGGNELTAFIFDGSGLKINIDWQWNYPLKLKVKLPVNKTAVVVNNSIDMKSEQKGSILDITLESAFKGHIAFDFK